MDSVRFRPCFTHSVAARLSGRARLRQKPGAWQTFQLPEADQAATGPPAEVV